MASTNTTHDQPNIGPVLKTMDKHLVDVLCLLGIVQSMLFNISNTFCEIEDYVNSAVINL